MIDLRKSTERVVRVGPFVDRIDGVTAETSVTLGGADYAAILKYEGESPVSITSATWAAVSGADGWYNLTLTASHTDTVGDLTIVIHNDAVHLPVRVFCRVFDQTVFDRIYAPIATLEVLDDLDSRTSDLVNRLTSGRATLLDKLDTDGVPIADNAITSATVASSALNGKGDWSSAASVAAIQTDVDGLVAQLDGIGSLADWLRAMTRSDIDFNSTAITEINDGVGDYDASLRSLEALGNFGSIEVTHRITTT